MFNPRSKKPKQRKDGIKDYHGILWNYYKNPPLAIRIKYQIYINNEAIIYTKGGRILRSDKINEDSQMPQVLENLEQIKYLKWISEYGPNNKKQGFWKATWKGDTIQGAGGRYQNGKKEGRWMDLFKNYWTKAQVYEVGDYQNDMRIGQWKYQYKDYEAGGGDYNIKGLKSGKWVEFVE